MVGGIIVNMHSKFKIAPSIVHSKYYAFGTQLRLVVQLFIIMQSKQQKILADKIV